MAFGTTGRIPSHQPWIRHLLWHPVRKSSVFIFLVAVLLLPLLRLVLLLVLLLRGHVYFEQRKMRLVQ